tara:strand:+ start:745 stop:1023 length:279 start_codon:yes stop_codon:yes gene_type:complete
LDIRKKSSCADYLIIATCRSARHVNAVADDITIKLKKKGIKCPQPEGKPKCDWTIIDAGDVIIHLFREEIRLHYDLEKLWDINLNSLKEKII